MKHQITMEDINGSSVTLAQESNQHQLKWLKLVFKDGGVDYVVGHVENGETKLLGMYGAVTTAMRYYNGI